MITKSVSEGRESFYDFSPLVELLEKISSPGECSKILRRAHQNYTNLLTQDFVDSEAIEGGKEIEYTNETLELENSDLLHIKRLADCLEEIDVASISLPILSKSQ